jgi:predicted RNA-binding protein with PUA-like domain
MQSSKSPQNWLLKTEPGTYSFQQLLKDKKTNWNDVRNFQARNFLKRAAPGDFALIYHSGDDKAVVGLAKVVKPAYADPDPEDPKTEWVQIDVAAVEAFKQPVTLKEIKATKALAELPLIKQSRLSVMPITASQLKTLLRMGGVAHHE